MSDLDDIADAARPQNVPVRRFPVPSSSPQRRPLDSRPDVVVVNRSFPPPAPRSAFSAGFFGTFGGIAAIIVVWIGYNLYITAEKQMAEIRLIEARNTAARMDREHRAAEAAAMKEMREAEAAREAKWNEAIEARNRQIQKQTAAQRAAWHNEVEMTLNESFPATADADHSLAIRGKIFGDEIDYYITNGSKLAIGGCEVSILVNGGLASIDRVPAIPAGVRVLRTARLQLGDARSASLAFKVAKAFFSPAP